MTAAPTHAVRRLRALNVGVGLAHLAQGVVILVLANDFATPVTATFLAGPPGGGPGNWTSSPTSASARSWPPSCCSPPPTTS